jgi:hypothetical protein
MNKVTFSFIKTTMSDLMYNNPVYDKYEIHEIFGNWIEDDDCVSTDNNINVVNYYDDTTEILYYEDSDDEFLEEVGEILRYDQSFFGNS